MVFKELQTERRVEFPTSERNQKVSIIDCTILGYETCVLIVSENRNMRERRSSAKLLVSQQYARYPRTHSNFLISDSLFFANVKSF